MRATCVSSGSAPIVIAGGGGGGGTSLTGGQGPGGNGSGGSVANGGAGVTNTGSTGTNGGSGTTGGGGGSTTTTGSRPYGVANLGGAAGNGSNQNGTAGGINGAAAGNGGSAGFFGGGGGGGGGGYASGGGGGGGGFLTPGGGGGGGSGYSGGTATIDVTDVTIGVGSGSHGGGGVNSSGTPGYATFTGVGITGPAAKLVFTQSPSSSTGGRAFGTQPEVTVTDAGGNVITNDSSTVSLTITSGTPTSGGPGTLSGCSQTETAGVISFSGCKIDKSGTGYKLHATAAGLTAADSSAFEITAGAAAKLAFTTQPDGASAGAAFTTQPKVTVQDAFGNTVTTDSSTVTLSITAGTPTSGGPGTLSGCSQTEASGVISFAGCKIDTVGANYKLHAVDGSLDPHDSAAFSIAGPAGADVQGANHNDSRNIATSDTVTFTFTAAMDPATIASGLTAGGSVSNITVTLTNASPRDTLTVPNVGVVDLGSSSWISSGSINYTNSTLALSADGKTLTLTIGTGTTSSTGPSTSTLRWTPGSGLKDLGGNLIDTTQVTESGSSDQDF